MTAAKKKKKNKMKRRKRQKNTIQQQKNKLLAYDVVAIAVLFLVFLIEWSLRKYKQAANASRHIHTYATHTKTNHKPSSSP